MKNTVKFLLLCTTIVLYTSCNEIPATGTSTADSASVKKMSTDSNSDMPVHIPQDSTETMPNALDSAKNINPR